MDFDKYKEYNKNFNRELYRKRHPGSKRYASAWLATEVNTGKTKKLRSERDLVIFFGYSLSSIKSYIKRGKPLGGYRIEKLYEE